MADLEAVDRDLAALTSAVPDVRALIERYGERDLRLANIDAVLAQLGEAGELLVAAGEQVTTDTLVDRPSFLPLGWVAEREGDAGADAELQAEADLTAHLASAPRVPAELQAASLAEPEREREPEPEREREPEPERASSSPSVPDVTEVSAAPLDTPRASAAPEPDAADRPALSIEAAFELEDAGFGEPPVDEDEPVVEMAAEPSEAPAALELTADSEPPQLIPSEPPDDDFQPGSLPAAAPFAADSQAPLAEAGEPEPAPEPISPSQPPRRAELKSLLDEAIDPSDFDAPVAPARSSAAPAPASVPAPGARSSFPPRPRSSSPPRTSMAPPLPLPPVPRPSLPVPSAAAIPDADELELLVDDDDIIEISDDA